MKTQFISMAWRLRTAKRKAIEWFYAGRSSKFKGQFWGWCQWELELGRRTVVLWECEVGDSGDITI